MRKVVWSCGRTHEDDPETPLEVSEHARPSEEKIYNSNLRTAEEKPVTSLYFTWALEQV